MKNAIRDYAIKYASRLLETAIKLAGPGPLTIDQVRCAYMHLNEIKHHRLHEKEQSLLSK